MRSFLMADRWEAFKAVTVASENIDCQVWVQRKDAEVFGINYLTEHTPNLDFQL